MSRHITTARQPCKRIFLILIFCKHDCVQVQISDILTRHMKCQIPTIRQLEIDCRHNRRNVWCVFLSRNVFIRLERKKFKTKKGLKIIIHG